MLKTALIGMALVATTVGVISRANPVRNASVAQALDGANGVYAIRVSVVADRGGSVILTDGRQVEAYGEANCDERGTGRCAGVALLNKQGDQFTITKFSPDAAPDQAGELVGTRQRGQTWYGAVKTQTGKVWVQFNGNGIKSAETR